MLDHFVTNRAVVARLRSGTIGPHLNSFVEHLAGLGYTHSTMCAQISILGRFDRWMARRGLDIADLNESVLERFGARRGQATGRLRGESATIRRLLAYLRGRGAAAAPAAPVVDAAPLSGLQGQYEHYLASERGLAPATLTNYGGFFRQFLAARFGAGPIELRALTAADISAFVLRHAHGMSPGRAKLMVTALRSMFRFFLQRGAIDRDLAASVPTVANWRLATVPKYLRPDEIDCLLQACDRTTAAGRRDHVILLLLARLGLRAGEVVTVELDDIHWRAGEITVRGSKGHRGDRLPLPTDVGAALAAYIGTDRPRLALRRVFLCTRAPQRGFAGPGAVSTIVRRALARTGLRPAVHGAHLLRHSLATRLLQAGASLSEIGQILRHQAMHTTEIYAKVDLAGLQSVARPWPGAGGER
jgi:site-specific recombinase XerD